MIVYPNQRTVTIFKEDCKKDFLQIGNEEWKTACSTIENYGTFKLYLYFASNKNGYTLALSPSMIEEEIGISESTYRRAFKELEAIGYLRKVEGKKNQFWFDAKI